MQGEQNSKADAACNERIKFHQGLVDKREQEIASLKQQLSQAAAVAVPHGPILMRPITAPGFEQSIRDLHPGYMSLFCSPFAHFPYVLHS